MRVTQSLLSLLVAICLVGFVGCGSGEKKPVDSTVAQDDHGDEEHGEEHEHPETYEAAVAELQELTAQIKAGFDKDDADAAHGPLHEVGHVLEILEDMVIASDFSEEAKKSSRAAIDSLFASFGAVDDLQHGLEGKEFKEVSAQIDADVKTLAAQGGPTEAAPE